MLQRPFAALLSIALSLSSWLPAAAQMFRGPAPLLPTIVSLPIQPSQGAALARFGAWLGTREGASILQLEPALGGLRTVDFRDPRSLLAAAPLVRNLPAGLLARLETIDRLEEGERQVVLAQLIMARQKAADEVNHKVAQAVGGVAQAAYVQQASPESLEAFASHIELFSWYGGGVAQAAAFVRETASGLREALGHTQKVAEETARRLAALKPAETGLITGVSKDAAPQAQASPAHKGPGLALPIHSFKLDNGLTVVVSPDHASPTVAVSITYKVGSQHERPGRSGFAHLFEHLMAQGTKNLKPREISKLIEGNGGIRNAYTTRTNTTYHSMVPKSALQVVLWAEADRMHTLDVNARALALEKQVVLEEMRRSYLNQPYRKAQDAGMAEAAFTKWENRHTTIGEAEDIRNAELEDVRAFYKAHYAPNNAVLSIAGDVTVEEARELAGRYFGPIPSREVASEPDLSEPPMQGERRVEIADSLAELPKLFVGWRAPDRSNKDFWALSMLTDIFSGGEESPLYQTLVKGAKLALSAEAGFPWWSSPITMHGPDLFGLEIQLKVGAAVEQVMAEVDRVIARIAQDGPSADDMARVKARAELQWANGMQSLLERAKTLGSYAALVGDPQGVTDDLKMMLAVSASDVRDAARRWMQGAARRIVHVTPAEAQAPAAEPATPAVPSETPRAPGEAPPAVGASTPAPLPKLVRFTLKNGLKVVLVHDERMPLLEARLTLEAGRVAERPGEEGLAEAAAHLALKGTPEQDGAAIARSLGKLGWSAQLGAEDDFAIVSAGGLARNAPAFFHQLAKVLGKASFPESEVALWKDNTAQKLKALRSDPEFLMDERLKAELYGPEHPYGRPLMTDEALAGVDAGKLAAFRGRAYSPQGATLVLVGDIDPAEARDMLEDTLKAWKGAPASSETPEVSARGSARFVLVDRPGSRQANLTISQSVPLDRKHPDFLAFIVATHILGGTSTSRLFLNLRTDKGYTYGSYAQAAAKGKGLEWVANAETRSEVALPALREMQNEIRRMREEAVPADVLEAAKRNLAGRFAIQLASLGSTASRLAMLERSGVDSADDLAGYVRRLEALTPEDIQRAARLYLDPEKMITIAVGDQATLAPLLAPFKP